MATEKSTTRKAPAKKAAVKKTTLTPADLATIAEIAAVAAAEAVKAAMTPTGRPSPASVASMPLTPEVIAQMTDEEIQEFNDGEARKAAARKASQEANRAKYENMSAGDRARALSAIRDPDIIRTATPPGWSGGPDDMVRVICKRRIGLTDGEMSDLDEVIDVPRLNAKDMQKSGVIEVQI